MIATLLALFGRSAAVTTSAHAQSEAERDSFEAVLQTALQGTPIAAPGSRMVLRSAVFDPNGEVVVAQDPSTNASLATSETLEPGTAPESESEVPFTEPREPAISIAVSAPSQTTVAIQPSVSSPIQSDAVPVELPDSGGSEPSTSTTASNSERPAQPAPSARDESQTVVRAEPTPATPFGTVPSSQSARAAVSPEGEIESANPTEATQRPADPGMIARATAFAPPAVAALPRDASATNQDQVETSTPSPSRDATLRSDHAPRAESPRVGTAVSSDRSGFIPIEVRTALPRVPAIAFEPILWRQSAEPGSTTAITRGHDAMAALNVQTKMSRTANDGTDPVRWNGRPLMSGEANRLSESGSADKVTWKSAAGVSVRVTQVESTNPHSDHSQPSSLDRPAQVQTVRERAEAPSRSTEESARDESPVRRIVRPVEASVVSRGASNTTSDLAPSPTVTPPTGRDASAVGPRGETASAQLTASLANEGTGDLTVARPRSSVTLRVDDASGASARIRVAVRGDHVRTAIVHDDPFVASRLASKAEQLHQSLTTRGFGESTITVHASPTSSDHGHDNARSSERESRAPDRGPEDDRRGEDRDARRQQGRARDRSSRERER